MPRDVGVIVPAAGRGRRLGSRRTKVLVPLAGRPLIFHTLRALQDAPSIGWIVLVVRPADRARLGALVRRARLTKVCAVVVGASSRSGSVARGMAALPPAARWVVIHDGARPCVRRQLIETVVRQAKRYGAAVCALPVALTVKAVDRSRTVRMTLDRDHLWLVQTPQAFRRDWFTQAVAQADGQLERFPDDAALLEWAGFPVHVVDGDPLNLKVTTPEDLLVAAAVLTHRARGQR